MRDFTVINTHIVSHFARYCALNDLALALCQGEDIDELAWGPEHTTALAKYVGRTVRELSEEVGEDAWAELISAAQNAYDGWMRLHAEESRELRAERLAYGWSVVDGRGGRWWPSDEGQEYLETAKNPAFEALRGCISGVLWGTWHN